MSRHGRFALLPILAAFLACNSNPVLVDDGNLTAELSLSSGHVHTLSELGVEVVIRNGAGFAVDDFEAVTVERRSEGGSWRGIDMAPHGEGFAGSYVFSSSGAYELRVMVTRHGSSEAVEVPLADPALHHLDVARAHVELDGYRIEFETFPGHIHEGDEVEVKFWVLEPERDADGVRPPITGLDAKLLCYEVGEMVEEHHAHGHEDGGYEALHTFAEAGDASAKITFPNDHGDEVEASFDFHVVHGH